MKLCFQAAFEAQQKQEYEQKLLKLQRNINTFTPPGTWLQNLAPHLMDGHRMTHIRYNYDLFGKLKRLFFKFTGDVLSPACSTYSEGAISEVAIPAHPDI